MGVAVVLILLVLAVIAFVSEKVPVDVVSASLLILLVVTGIITPKEAFTPFGSDFIIMLAAIFVVTTAIDSSGILESWSMMLMRKNKGVPKHFLFPLVTITSIFSAFMNNTSVTAMMINPAMTIARRMGISNSKVLMPLAYASIVGGTCTLIGTSTNVAVNAYLSTNGYPTLGMFDFTAIGIVMVVITIIYLSVIAVRILPDRKPEVLTTGYGLREYLCEIVIRDNAVIADQTVANSMLTSLGFQVLSITRNNRQFVPGPNVRIEVDDVLLLKGKVEQLLHIRSISGVDVKADIPDFNTLDKSVHLQEVVIPGRSGLAGQSLSEADLRRNYGMTILAIHRQGKNIIDTPENTILEVGDMLLVQIDEKRLRNPETHSDLVILADHESKSSNTRRGYIMLGIFILAVICSSLDLLPVSIAFLAAAVIGVLIKAIQPEDIYKSIEWKLLVLIGGMSAFGTAMINSGADKFLAGIVVDLAGPLGGEGIVAGFMILTVLLTQPMSNAAAALVVLPVALSAATIQQLNPLTFAVAVMLSASVSLITPFEPSCILVYGPGKYKFADYLKTGGLLTLILMVCIYFGTLMLWPL